MACTRMTALRRAKSNGDWFARKRIPEDIRSAYEWAHGKRQEERFRLAASVSQGVATQEFRDWDAEISSRIERLRARGRGEGEASLTVRQAHALAGTWYSWFIAQYEEDPGTADEWGIVADEYEEVCLKFRPRDEHTDLLQEEEPRTDLERHAVHRTLTRLAKIDRFLLDKERMLSDTAMHAFLDVLEAEFPAALRLLSRRADGDWSHDSRPEKFPQFAPQTRPEPARLSGLTVWTAFELWIAGRNPAASSVNRWRYVFLRLREQFGERDIATLTPEEAQQWVDSLTNAKRSAHVAHSVWLRATNVIFRWAVARKRLQSNPFEDVSIALPKRAPKLREREFNEDEWRTILRATLTPFTRRVRPHKAAAQRWVPWICAYTGARPGEACQLRAEDIRQHKEGGFWYARITPEAGTVKGSEAREVPIHPHLIEQGFIAFVQHHSRGPLFYDPKARRKFGEVDPANPLKGQWVKSRDKLSAWVRSLGIDDRGISPNHAWRHTFKRRAARAGIERRFRFAMCGHASKEEGDGYETPTLEDLAAEITKLPRYEV
jgi:integrase